MSKKNATNAISNQVIMIATSPPRSSGANRRRRPICSLSNIATSCRGGTTRRLKKCHQSGTSPLLHLAEELEVVAEHLDATTGLLPVEVLIDGVVAVFGQ